MHQAQSVFGVPIEEVIAHEQQHRCKSLDGDGHLEPDKTHHQLAPPASATTLTVPTVHSHLSRSSSGNSESSQGGDLPADLLLSVHCCPPSPMSDTGRHTPHTPRTPMHSVESMGSSTHSPQYEPHQPQVPRIVENCTDYLKRHGMDTIGLFRVAGSAKRCRQMRVELDSGQEVGEGVCTGNTMLLTADNHQ